MGFLCALTVSAMPRVALLLLLVCVAPASAQERLEIRWLRAVHHSEHPVLTAWFGAADASAYTVFYSSTPAMWAAVLPGWVETEQAVRWTAGVGGGILAAGLLKHTVQRPRPYRTLSDIKPRRNADQLDRLDPFSFPSGHATLAFAHATSAALAWPEWYVIVPAYVWASGVAISRLWIGVHYPSDVLVGVLIGTGMAVLAEALMPAGKEGVSVPPMLTLNFRF